MDSEVSFPLIRKVAIMGQDVGCPEKLLKCQDINEHSLNGQDERYSIETPFSLRSFLRDLI